MKIMRKIFLPMMLLVVMLIGGCTSGNTGNTGGTGSENAGTNGESGKKVTLRVIAHAEMQDQLEPFFKSFTAEYPNITVEGLYGVDQLDQIETNSPPDLLFTGNVQLEGIKYLFEDLDPYIDNYFESEEDAEAFRDSFLGDTLTMMQKDDKQMLLPIDINVSLLYYNKTLFDNAGLDYPTADWTYDDFISAGQKLTVKTEDDVYTQWGCSTTSGWWGEYLIYVRQAGGDFYLEDGKTPAVDTDAFKEGIQFYKDKTVAGKYGFSPNPDDTAIGHGNLGGFISQKTAMEFGGHIGNWPSYNALEDFEWDVAELPTPVDNPDARGAELAAEGYGIYTGSENKDEAFKLLMYFFSEKGQRMLGNSGNLVPTEAYKEYVLAIPKEERSNPQNMEAVFNQIETAVALPVNSHFEASACAPVCNELSRYLKGIITIDQFGDNAKKAIEDLVNTLY